MALAEVAFAAFTAHDLPDGVEPNLEAQVTWDPPNFTFPFGSHIAVVEVDHETGNVDLIDYAAVDDCGTQINPLIVEGQVHGGIVQGVGQALWEEAVYDDDGQLRSANLADYLVPSAAEMPVLEAGPHGDAVHDQPARGEGHRRSRHDRLDAGGDERGGRRPRPLGVTDVTMPASPWNVRRAIDEATGGGS